MKSIHQQIVALFLSLLIMMTTVSFTVDLHVCAGSIVDISFAQEELSCSASLMGELSDEAHNAMRNMGCCDDLQFEIEGQDELSQSYLGVQIDNPDFLTVSPSNPEIDWVHSAEKVVRFTSYIPPPLIQDIQILHQTFLL